MGKLSLGSWAVALCLLVFGACSSDGKAPAKPNTCASDAECGAGLRCDARAGCVACLFDTDCGDGQRCEQGNCATRVPCTSSADCKSSAAPACDTTLGECFTCVTNTDCKTGEKCEHHSCHGYVACANSLDCPTGQVCSDDAACVECVGDADCTSENTCVQNRCEARCSSDKDCVGSGLLCDTDSKHCVECVASSDCPDRYHCTDGTCERDVCEEGASRCTVGGAAVETCPSPGKAWIKQPCGGSQSCRQLGGKAECESWQCAPGSNRCSADGRRIEICNADGLGTTVGQQCGAGQACVNAACKDVTCQPGATFCLRGDVYLCSADGLTSTQQQICGAGSFCDAASGKCQARICTPGDHSCVDGQVGTCNALGSAYEDLRACKKHEVCEQGACAAIVCDRDGYACDDGGHLVHCNETGTVTSVVQTCGSDQTCRVDPESDVHECAAKACEAGKTACDGNRIAVCNADGSGFESGGTECGPSKVCFGGTCKAKVCTAGTRFCKDGDVRLCTEQGSNSQLYQTCDDADDFCDVASATCKTQVCTPNELGCNGQVAATCKADGSGYLAAGAVDCAAAKKTCELGTCKPKVCTPSATFCSSGNVYQCNAAGTGSSLLTTCTASSYFCSANGDTASCSYDVCTAGTLGCSNNTITTCRADGSGYDLGTDCGAKACVNGACAAKVCTPDKFQCSGTTSQLCNATGTAWINFDDCAANTYCSATSGRCELDVCPAGAKACVNEQLGTCSADGSALSAGATDCKASSNVCTLAGCAASATDTLGDSSSSYYYSGYVVLFGDIVYATSSRKLTELQQDMTSSASLRWVVYVSDTLAGPYTPMFDVAGTAPNTGFQTSGPISVSIAAGKYYFFGSIAQPTYFYQNTRAGTQYVSFGRSMGAYAQYLGSATVPPSFTFSSSTALAHIQLTTVLP